MATWPDDGSTRAVLARTNRELLVAVVAALDLGLPFRAPDLSLLLEDPRVDELLAAPEIEGSGSPLLLSLGRLRARVRVDDAGVEVADPDAPSRADLVTALLGWSAALGDATVLRDAVAARRERLRQLRREDAAMSLATAHGTKGLEWDHVLVLTDGFPGRRSVTDATEPERALEEERRLAYVAWTRARRSLTLLYDPAAPSAFLREAFDPDELGLPTADAAA
jgi:hypothetical protein